MFHFHRNKWQTTVLQYLGYQMFSPLQTNYLPKVMKCRWCSLTTKHTGMKIDKATKIPSDHMIMLKIFFGIHFCRHAKMIQINLFNFSIHGAETCMMSSIRSQRDPDTNWRETCWKGSIRMWQTLMFHILIQTITKISVTAQVMFSYVMLNNSDC